MITLLVSARLRARRSDLGALTRLVFFNETQENASSLSLDAG